MKKDLFLVNKMSLYATRLELLSLMLDEYLEYVTPFFSDRDTLQCELRCLVSDQLKYLVHSFADDIEKVGH
ncbi:MAG: hypothetical protein IJ766_08785 [Clostridia bacterium]|nr:hypothetical protein [Clostridia bacterium]